MLGWSDKDVGRSVFEIALKKFGFPDSVRYDLCEQYQELNRFFRATGLDDRECQTRKERLVEKVRTQMATLVGDRYLSHLAFGHDLARLKLMLEHWERLPAKDDVSHRAGEYLEALQEHATAVGLPPNLAGRLYALRAVEIKRRECRNDVLQALSEVLAYLDPGPD